MLDPNSFENLLERSESSIIDFKREMYDFDNDNNQKKIAKYIKDIISFSNTVRTESSYIIIGVDKKADNSFDLIGIDKNIDESILQAKAKDKIFPIPVFSYYIIKYKDLSFGVFEFPIHKYQTPLTPTKDLSGLRIGMAYYRKGSSNEEAFGTILIHINEWLKSLPNEDEKNIITNSIADSVSELLIKAANIEYKLSILIVELLSFSKKHNLTSLTEFCTLELKGIDYKEKIEEKKFRFQNTIYCIGRIEARNMNPTQQIIINYLKGTNNYYVYNRFYNESISEIENYLIQLKPVTSYGQFFSNTSKLSPNEKKKGKDITFFMFYDTYYQLYSNIRQEIIETLIKL